MGLCAFVLLGACEKATEWLEETRLEAGSIKDPGGSVDEALAVQVKRGEGGVAFRRDLAFPKEIHGMFHEELTWENMLVHGSTVFGAQKVVLNGSYETEHSFSKGGGTFGMSYSKYLEKVLSPEELAALEDDEGGKKVAEDAASDAPGRGLTGKELSFANTAQGWRYQQSETGDFKAMVFGKELAEDLPKILERTACWPRSVWFSSSRFWKPGDTLELEGPSVKLLDPDAQTGTLVFAFEEEEAIDGHPCGRFSVEGRLVTRVGDQDGGDGMLGDVTIESGKVWASLLYPIVLREEVELIESSRRAGQSAGGEGVNHLQGRSRVVISIEWVPEAAPEEEGG